MRKANRLPLAMRAATQPGLLETFKNNNALLDQIQKCLEAYLESKRCIFPRSALLVVSVFHSIFLVSFLCAFDVFKLIEIILSALSLIVKLSGLLS